MGFGTPRTQSLTAGYPLLHSRSSSAPHFRSQYHLAFLLHKAWPQKTLTHFPKSQVAPKDKVLLPNKDFQSISFKF